MSYNLTCPSTNKFHNIFNVLERLCSNVLILIVPNAPWIRRPSNCELKEIHPEIPLRQTESFLLNKGNNRANILAES